MSRAAHGVSTLHVLTLTPFFPSDQNEVNGCFVAEPIEQFQQFLGDILAPGLDLVELFGREPKRRRRARRRPGMGRGSGFATERCHCQLFRGFRAGPRDAFDAACTGPFRFGMRQTSLAIHRACIVRLRPGRDDPASGASRSWGYARMKTRHPRSYTHRAIRRG